MVISITDVEDVTKIHVMMKECTINHAIEIKLKRIISLSCLVLSENNQFTIQLDFYN